MVRKAFKMKLHPGMEDEYRRRHEMLWPEMRDIIREHGGRNYSIFLDGETNSLFAYLEVDDEEKWAAIANTGVCRRWWDYMAPIMAVNTDNSPVSHDLHCVFHLD